MPEIAPPQPSSVEKPPIKVQNPSVTGDLRLHEFTSWIFRNRRFLRVWLPPAYDAPENQSQRYPVLYLNDGQNLFEAQVAFGGVEWQVDETADRLIREGRIPPMIIVGIDHAGANRMKEYVPYRSLRPSILRPRGKRYPDFLIKEVMPFVEQHYRVATGPENTGLGGSSLGALIALYTVIDRPKIIGRLLLESPSLFMSNKGVLKYSRYLKQGPERVYLAIGTVEAGNRNRDLQVVDDVLQLERIIRAAGFGEGQLLVTIDQGAPHSEAAWAKRFPEALEFLFGAQAGT